MPSKNVYHHSRPGRSFAWHVSRRERPNRAPFRRCVQADFGSRSDEIVKEYYAALTKAMSWPWWRSFPRALPMAKIGNATALSSKRSARLHQALPVLNLKPRASCSSRATAPRPSVSVSFIGLRMRRASERFRAIARTIGSCNGAAAKSKSFRSAKSFTPIRHPSPKKVRPHHCRKRTKQ